MAAPLIDRAVLEALSPSEQAEAAELLERVAKGVEANPLLGWRPHPKQDVFLSSHTPIKAFLGGNRSGKTEAGIVDDLIQCVDGEILPPWLSGYKRWQSPFHGRVVVPDLNATLEGVMFPKVRRLVPRAQLVGQSFDSAYDKQRRILHFQNGSWLQFMTFEMDVDKFSGAALHRVHFDEEPPEDIRRECRMRLIDYAGDELFTMTPLLGMTWLYDSVYERRHEDHITVVQVDMDDNPHLNEEAKLQALEGLSDEERRARKEGKFVHFGGLVFEEFDETHVVDDPDPDHIQSQDIVVGIDPGVRWTGVTFNAFDTENDCLTFDELLLTSATIETVANEIKKKIRGWGLQLDDCLFVIDPSARNRTQDRAENMESEFLRFDIPCMPGDNNLEAGILQMKRRLQGGAWTIARRCRELIRQIGRYRLDRSNPGKFAVVKVDDHACDSARYALVARSWGGVLPETRKRRRRWNESYPPPRRNQTYDAPSTGSMT